MWRGLIVLCEELLSKNTRAIPDDSGGNWTVNVFRPHEQEPVRGCSRSILPSIRVLCINQFAGVEMLQTIGAVRWRGVGGLTVKFQIVGSGELAR